MLKLKPVLRFEIRLLLIITVIIFNPISCKEKAVKDDPAWVGDWVAITDAYHIKELKISENGKATFTLCSSNSTSNTSYTAPGNSLSANSYVTTSTDCDAGASGYARIKDNYLYIRGKSYRIDQGPTYKITNGLLQCFLLRNPFEKFS